MREVPNLSDSLCKTIVQKVREVIPPRDRSTSRLLAGAGDLVVEHLRFTPQYDDTEISNTISVLVDIDSAESRQMILSYVEQMPLNDKTLDAMFDARTYIDDDEFAVNLINKLCKRNSAKFYCDKTLRVFSKKQAYWRQDLPEIRRIIVDCYLGTDAAEILGINEMYDEPVAEVAFINCETELNLNWLLSVSKLEELAFIEINELVDISGIAGNTSIERIILYKTHIKKY